MRLGGNRRWVPLFGIDDFHEHLNRQKADMQFTKDIEENGKITFLDCLVTRDNNKLKTTIYRKPTHTDRLRDQSSYNPTKVILAVCGKPYVGLSPINLASVRNIQRIPTSWRMSSIDFSSQSDKKQPRSLQSWLTITAYSKKKTHAAGHADFATGPKGRGRMLRFPVSHARRCAKSDLRHAC